MKEYISKEYVNAILDRLIDNSHGPEHYAYGVAKDEINMAVVEAVEATDEMCLVNAREYCKELYDEINYPGRSQEFIDAMEVAIADLSDMPAVMCDGVNVSKLKRCPHCGLRPLIKYACGEYYVVGSAKHCPVCDYFDEMHSSESTEIETWNRMVDYGN